MKKSLLNIVFTLFYLFQANMVLAASPSQALTDLLGQISVMRASFIQTVYDNRGKAVQQSYGKMALSRPGKFRWEVLRPMPQIIIANNTRLWIYDPDLQQVTIRSLKEAAGDTPALLLSHPGAVLDHDYVVRSIQKKSSPLQWYSLTPKNPDNMFESVEMGFQNTQIKEMRLTDHIGHTTRIEFQRIEVNPSLPSSLFSFIPPKNVDVIDETRR